MLIMSIKYKGWVPDGVGKRQMNNVFKAAFEHIGNYWHDKIKKKHFKETATKEYGYKLRQGEESGTSGRAFWRSYTGRKLRYRGHRLPLVFTFESRRISLGQKRVTATNKEVKVYEYAKKFNFSRRKRIDMFDEVGRVSPSDMRMLAFHFEHKVVQLLKDMEPQLREDAAFKAGARAWRSAMSGTARMMSRAG